MHRTCSSKLTAVLCVTLLAAGCQRAPVQTMTIGEWMNEAAQRAGLSKEVTETPYFANVTADSPYFVPVQSAVDFGILETQYAIDPEAELSRQWAAYTMVNLLGASLTDASQLKDVSTSPFASHCETAVQLGLMQADGQQRFFPERVMSKEEALHLLDDVVKQINDPSIATKEKAVISQDADIVRIQPLSFDESKGIILLEPKDDISAGSLVSWMDEDGREYVYEVNDLSEDGSKSVLHVVPADLSSYSDELQLEGEDTIDFSKAEILEDPDDDTASIQDPFLSPASIHKLQRQKTINGYTVVWSATSSGITASVSKNLGAGSEASARLRLNGIKVKYKWYSRKDDVNNAFFRLSAHSEESLQVKAGSYKTLYGDFSALKAKDFPDTLAGFLKEKKEMAETEIPICTIRVPVNGSSTVTVKARLFLRLFTSGKVQLTLSQDHVMGMEARNGSVRVIRDFDHDQNALIKADAGLTGNLRFSLDFLKQQLMDIGMEAGAKAAVSATMHLFDEEGEMTSVPSVFDADVTDELAQGNPDVLVCTDINAYWLLKLHLNSSSSLLGRLGFGKDLSILDGDNASIFPHGAKHMENWQFVDECTRTSRHKAIKSEEKIAVRQRIQLSSYARTVGAGQSVSIEITGLPQGYSRKDLVYTCADTAIVSVSSDGTVTGIQPGSTEITIATKDGKYSVKLSVLVPSSGAL
ncbi:MAG: Ig-like domain-containing protein [Lactimicrobium sp.]